MQTNNLQEDISHNQEYLLCSNEIFQQKISIEVDSSCIFSYHLGLFGNMTEITFQKTKTPRFQFQFHFGQDHPFHSNNNLKNIHHNIVAFSQNVFCVCKNSQVVNKILLCVRKYLRAKNYIYEHNGEIVFKQDDGNKYVHWVCDNSFTLKGI